MGFIAAAIVISQNLHTRIDRHLERDFDPASPAVHKNIN